MYYMNFFVFITYKGQLHNSKPLIFIQIHKQLTSRAKLKKHKNRINLNST